MKFAWGQVQGVGGVLTGTAVDHQSAYPVLAALQLLPLLAAGLMVLLAACRRRGC